MTYVVISISIALSFKCSGMVAQVNLSSFTKRSRSITLESSPSALAFFHGFDYSATFLLNGFSIVLRDVSILIGCGIFQLFFP